MNHEHEPLWLDADCCVIRPFQLTDRESLIRNANNWHVARNMRDRFPHPYTASDADRWLEFVATHKPLTKFAIAVADELAGGIGLELQDDIFRRSAEIGYWLGESFWGRGIATAAVRVFTRYAFEAHDLVRIYANVFSWNPGSAHVLEKAGYICEGIMRQSVVKDGQVIDAALYAITRDMLGAADQLKRT